MNKNNKQEIITGKSISPGMGKGKVYIYKDIFKRLDEFYEIEDHQIDTELQRFQKALSKISEDLSKLAKRVKKEIDTDLSMIFQAHLEMVKDKSLQAEVEHEIQNELVSAGLAIKTVFRRWERRFRSMEAEISQQKGDDIRDLNRRLLSSLAGVSSHVLDDLPPGHVLVTHRLLPSDTIFLADRKTNAAIIEKGGAGSHAALFAHEIGLPCVANFSGLLDTIKKDDFVLVDADEGKITINPEPKSLKVFEDKLQKKKQKTFKAIQNARQPAVTKNGKTIPVLANVGNAEDTRNAINNGADGIGLYRIENIYLGRQTPPDKEELFEAIYNTIEPAKGFPVNVRLLDVGADKPLPFMESFRELNPSLGMRGIRFLLEYPDLLQTQIEVLSELALDFELNILVPMVTLPSDLQQVKHLLTDSTSNMKNAAMPKLGAMIETPAAALSVAEIANFADFLSVGTNDLTQYSFAADRENASVDKYFDDTNKVIFRLIEIVHKDVPEIPLSICGELAGRTKYTSKLLECGISSLSVAPPSIPMVKQEIHNC